VDSSSSMFIFDPFYKKNKYSSKIIIAERK